ncbi:MAG: hypothetical protein EOP33_04435 [Rickettsiaceae bacterium]|nr:MAG: hypothetical protein EOP33_04435 [Rickettsiaceae bacterium]
MKQISIYQTCEQLLKISLCQIVEKCYDSELITMLVINDELVVEIDNLLWTYSQKSFIPHGSQLDQLPKQQPVYLSSEFININHANTLVLLNPSKNHWQTFTTLFLAKNNNIKDNTLEKLNRIIIVSSDNDAVAAYKEQISKHTDISLNCYHKSSGDSKWSKSY